MSFNSLTYLWFLPLVFCLYWFVFRRLRWQNAFVVVASYVFYGWWDWRFLLLIAFTTAASYAFGLGIEHYRQQPGKAGQRGAWWCSLGNIVLNLLILGFFKYFNFFVGSTVAAASLLGWHIDAPTLHILLPVGISFYTFQALSYTIDVYRGQIRASHDPIAFAAYICFFPQLVAGPIEKAAHLLPQFMKPRTFDEQLATDGMRQILWGFVLKLVIADNCGLVTRPLMTGQIDGYSGIELFLIAFCFYLQLYGDFAGYSDIAIGSAKLLGIRLTRNFNYPLFMRDFQEAWHRWHISLNSWFVDYVFHSLGGWRHQWRIMLNVIIVFTLSGLWHGANWTYVFWGSFLGILTAISMRLQIYRRARRTAPVVAYGRWLPSLKELSQMLIVLFLSVLSLVFFASPSIKAALLYFRSMALCIGWHPQHLETLVLPLSLIAALLLFEWTQRTNERHTLQLDFLPRHWQRWAVYLVLIIAIGYFYVPTTQFVYFQF